MPEEQLIPSVWIVGFTGHRPGDGPGRDSESIRGCRDAIRDALIRLRSETAESGGTIEMLTCVATGFDLEAAEIAQELGIPVHIMLPMSVDTFEHDFEGAHHDDDWPRAKRFIDAAKSGEAGTTFRICEGSHRRPDCYHEMNSQLLDDIDVLVAVCNDEPARGIGGTAQVIAQAQHRGLPVVRINPAADGATTWPDSNSTWKSADPLASSLLVSAVSPADSDAPASTVESGDSILERLDLDASMMGRRFRGRMLAAVYMHLAAAILAATTVAFSPVIHHHEKLAPDTVHGDHAGKAHFGLPQLLTAIELLLVLVALGVTLHVIFGKFHHEWRRKRFAAEIARGLCACARLIDPLNPLALRHAPSWRRFAVTLALLTHRSKPATDSTEQLKAQYLNKRVADQAKYFKRELSISQGWALWLGGIGVFATFFAPVFIGLAFYIKVFHSASVEQSYWAAMFAAWFPVVLPLLAGSATALVVAGDHARRRERYSVMAQRLELAKTQLETLETPGAVSRSVAQIEEILLDELVEWYAAAKMTGH